MLKVAHSFSFYKLPPTPSIFLSRFSIMCSRLWRKFRPIIERLAPGSKQISTSFSFSAARALTRRWVKLPSGLSARSLTSKFGASLT